MNNLSKYSVWFVLLLICVSCASTKLLNGDEEKYHLSTEEIYGRNCAAFTCVREVDEEFQSELKKEGKRLLQIYLIRHAKPNLKKKAFYSVQEAQQYMTNYNLVPIHPIDSGLVRVDLDRRHTIHCSSLRRSQETAQGIFGDNFPIVADSLFREFEIKAIRASSVIKVPLVVWQFFSRGTWFLGFNHRGIESFKEAKKRAYRCAEKLIESAIEEETSILVGHGMLNGAIERELAKQGWQTIKNKGHVNLGATILVKVVER
ncbi:MAG: histidine phosphatase family protein [Marinifilaceae bacterium]